MHTLAFYFWRGDFSELGMVVLGLGLLSLVLAGAALGAMFGMDKLMREKLPETAYGDFDFGHFDKAAFQNLVMRVLVLVGGMALALHLLEYMVVCREMIRHQALWALLLFVLQIAGIAGGLHYLFKLDRLRLAIITASCAVAYLIVMALLRSQDVTLPSLL